MKNNNLEEDKTVHKIPVNLEGFRHRITTSEWVVSFVVQKEQLESIKPIMGQDGCSFIMMLCKVDSVEEASEVMNKEIKPDDFEL